MEEVEAPHGDHLVALVDVLLAVVDDRGLTAAELAPLLLDVLDEVVHPDLVAGQDGADPLVVAAGEVVGDAAEGAGAGLADLRRDGRNGGALQGDDVLRWGDDPTPAGVLAVLFVAEERVVVAVAVGEVADRVPVRLVIEGRRVGNEHADAVAVALNAVLGDLPLHLGVVALGHRNLLGLGRWNRRHDRRGRRARAREGRPLGPDAPSDACPLSVSPRGDLCVTRRAGFSKVGRPPPPPALTPALSQRERGKTSPPYPFPNPRAGYAKVSW